MAPVRTGVLTLVVAAHWLLVLALLSGLGLLGRRSLIRTARLPDAHHVSRGLGIQRAPALSAAATTDLGQVSVDGIAHRLSESRLC